MSWRNFKNWGTAGALIVTFLVSGIWHGASWGFVFWGLLHGVYMACSVFYRPYQKKIHKMLILEKTKILKVWQIFLTFNLITFAWIFFRTKEIEDSLYVLRKIFISFTELFSIYRIELALTPGHNLANAKALFLAFVIFGGVSFFKNRINILDKPIWFRWSCYVLFLLSP